MATFLQDSIDNMCRTCLSKDVNLHQLFEVFVGDLSLNVIITIITGLEIAEGDGLPQTICDICKDKAETAYDFKSKSHEAARTLAAVRMKPKCELDEQAGTIEEAYDPDENMPNISTPDKSEAITGDEGDQSDDYNMQCKNCSELFSSEEQFHDHFNHNCILVKSEPQNIYCPICGQIFGDAGDLTSHMWEQHPELMFPKKRGRPKKTVKMINQTGNRLHRATNSHQVYDCIFCKLDFKTKDDIKLHMYEHSDTAINICLICKKMYISRDSFENHMCTADKNNIPTRERMKNMTEMTLQEMVGPTDNMENIHTLQSCKLCGGFFLSKSGLLDHIDEEHSEISRRCKLCNKIFASLKSASRHRKACELVERNYVCATCGMQFVYELSLNKHILKLHKGESVSVKFLNGSNKKLANKRLANDVVDNVIDKCEMTVDAAAAASAELLEAASAVKLYQCDVCNKSFPRRDMLNKHSKIHLEKSFECEVCHRKFNRKDNLRSHSRVHDAGRQPVPATSLCLYCGRSFNNSSNLIVHMRRHTGEKPYTCDFCGKGFPRSSDLQSHRRSHTGEKPNECGVCGKGFSRSSKLTRHMRVHTGQKPYKCPFCDKAFSQSNDLTLHVRRHTGDKPFFCEGTALQNHRRVHGHFALADSLQPQIEVVPRISQIFSVQVSTA